MADYARLLQVIFLNNEKQPIKGSVIWWSLLGGYMALKRHWSSTLPAPSSPSPKLTYRGKSAGSESTGSVYIDSMNYSPYAGLQNHVIVRGWGRIFTHADDGADISGLKINNYVSFNWDCIHFQLIPTLFTAVF